MGEHARREFHDAAPKGANVHVRNLWQRHAQKMSGEVFNAGATGISVSAISPAGAERSRELGQALTASEHGAKGYVSDSKRTEETLEGILNGYEAANPGAPIREKVRLREELVGWGPQAWLTKYNELWGANKAKLLAERGLKPEDFSTLSPDDQQVIAETAEEPVVRSWLDDPESELAKLHPPRVAAAKFAVLFNRRHERLAEKLNGGSDLDLLHVTHKTVTEPFLASGVLVRRRDGQHVERIADLGGSLGILDNWESDVETDDRGAARVTVNVRGEAYDVDPTKLQELVREGMADLRERREARLAKRQTK